MTEYLKHMTDDTDNYGHLENVVNPDDVSAVFCENFQKYQNNPEIRDIIVKIFADLYNISPKEFWGQLINHEKENGISKEELLSDFC